MTASIILQGTVSEKYFRDLINDFFYTDSDAESCNNSDSDSDSDCRDTAAESNVSVESDDDDETADEPVVSVPEVKSVLSSEAVIDTMCESQEAEWSLSIVTDNISKSNHVHNSFLLTSY